MPAARSTKVLVLGWDAADWKVIRPLLDAGRMPNLKQLIRRGVAGNIATRHPPLSPTLWTSIATGKRPPKHGILGFTEPTPDGRSVQPCSILSRKTKAVWNILAQSGKRSIVVGWWPSYPAEPILGAMVSNHFQKVSDDPELPLPPLGPGIVSPDRIASAVEELRVKPAEVPLEVVRMFVPRCDDVNQETDKRLHNLAKTLAETISIHAAATELLEHEPWDFAAIYFDAIDHACHGFMRYHPPRLDWVSEADFAIYKDVIASTYQYHDAMLGRYLELVDPATNIILLSDHGFHPDERRLSWIPAEPAGPADEHRQFGIVVMAGPGIRQGAPLYGTSVLDVTPTVLTLFGLPVGDDMDGAPQVEAWETPPSIARIPSWDDVPGDDGRHRAERVQDPLAAAEQLEQLVALGYVSPLPDDQQAAVSEAVRENDFNLARAWSDSGKPHEAIPILEKLWERWPREHRFGIYLLAAYARVNRVADRRRALSTLRERVESYAILAREQLAALKENQPAADGDPFEAEKPAARRRVFERRDLQQLAHGLDLEYFEIEQALLEKDFDHVNNRLAPLLAQEAAGELLRFDAASRLATTLVQIGRWNEALPIVERLIAVDPETPNLANLRAEILFRRRDWSNLVDAAAEGLALIYFNPRLHFILGLALARLGRKADAICELRVAVKQNPTLVRAYDALGRLHADHPLLALEYRQKASDLRRRIRAERSARVVWQAGSSAPPVTSAAPATTAALATTAPAVTSPVLATQQYDFSGLCQQVPCGPDRRDEEVIDVLGLPRSGTSMLMRVLEAGGIPVLSDGLRAADENNRHGYYEYEPIKKIAELGAAGWIHQAAGKAVKVVTPLVKYLPPKTPIRLLVVHRPLAQVLASQEAMKDRLGTHTQVSANSLATQFIAELEKVNKLVADRANWQILHLSYESMLADPAGQCARIAQFLGASFSPIPAAAAVDAAQRRFT